MLNMLFLVLIPGIITLFVTPREAADIREDHYIQKGGDDKLLPYLKRTEVTVKGDVECARACLNDVRCFSFNIAPPDEKDKNRCQLNMDTQKATGIAFQDMDGWRYFEGTREPVPTSGTWAAAYDSLHKWWFIAYGNQFFQFLELSSGSMSPQNTSNLQGYGVRGMLYRPTSTDDMIEFRCYLEGGGLADAYIDLTKPFKLEITTLAQDINALHGIPGVVDIQGEIVDAVRYNNLTYLLVGNSTYVLDEITEKAVMEFDTYNSTVPENPFFAAPRGLTAITELTPPKAMFFKGQLLFFYNTDERRITFASSFA